MTPNQDDGWRLIVHTEHAACYVSDAACLQQEEAQQQLRRRLAELYCRALPHLPADPV